RYLARPPPAAAVPRTAECPLPAPPPGTARAAPAIGPAQHSRSVRSVGCLGVPPPPPAPWSVLAQGSAAHARPPPGTPARPGSGTRPVACAPTGSRPGQPPVGESSSTGATAPHAAAAPPGQSATPRPPR